MVYKNLVLTVWSAFIFIFTEWIFLWTQPSSFLEKLSHDIQFLYISKTYSYIALSLLLFSLLGVAVQIFLNRILPQLKQFNLSMIPSAFILSLTILLMVDNFTYTVWGVGSITSTWYRYLYIVFFLGFMVIIQLKLSRLRNPHKIVTLFSALLITLSTLYSYNSGTWEVMKNQMTFLQKKPNIIFFGVDGVPSKYLSAYHFSKSTTPILDELVKDNSLVAENFFTNCAHTLGSTMSLLTGKHPLQTKVVYPPGDFFKGKDVYTHFLSLLRSSGYELIQLGSSGDMSDRARLLDSFHIVNGQNVDFSSWPFYKYFFDYDSSLFFSKVYKRVEERLLHVTGKKDYIYAEVITDNNEKSKLIHQDDANRIEYAQKYIQSAKNPFLLHVHLGSTHGKIPTPKKSYFSEGVAMTEENWEYFFLDTIREADQQFKVIIDELKAKNIYDNTIIVFYSDHGHLWKTDDPLPLVIRFPEGKFGGKRVNNLQNIDVVPTLMDYLGIQRPSDLMGQSFLRAEVDPDREIYAITYLSSENSGHFFIGANLIKGKTSYYYNAEKKEFSEKLLGNIEKTFLTSQEAQLKIEDYFQQWGYSFAKPIIWDEEYGKTIDQAIKYHEKLKLREAKRRYMEKRMAAQNS